MSIFSPLVDNWSYDKASIPWSLAKVGSTDFITLDENLDQSTADLVLGVIFAFGDLAIDKSTIKAFLEPELVDIPGAPAHYAEVIIPGGVEVRKAGQSIKPSCCAELRDWGQWYEVARGKADWIWMGHSPTPELERGEDRLFLWSDSKDKTRFRIELSPQEILDGLSFVERVLEKLAVLMSATISRHTSSDPNDWTRAFRTVLKLAAT